MPSNNACGTHLRSLAIPYRRRLSCPVGAAESARTFPRIAPRNSKYSKCIGPWIVYTYHERLELSVCVTTRPSTINSQQPLHLETTGHCCP